MQGKARHSKTKRLPVHLKPALIPQEGHLEQQILTAQQAARYLKVSDWLIYESVKRREIPHIKLGGRVLFRRDTLDTWMEGKERESIIVPSQYGILRKVETKL